jgi:phosphoribosyl 1,2-cyclic phosphate phosphodiesterase
MDADGKLKITFMGTGTSHGIPMIACNCPVCTSSDPRDQRYRCCLMIEYDRHVIIVDTPPEFRLQCIANHVTKVDALLFTHTHADHIFGLDDIRRFCAMQQQKIPCYSSARAIHSLKTIFSYAFKFDRPIYSEIPYLDGIEIDGPFELFGKTIIPLVLHHGNDRVLGFRIGNFAYCTDCSEIPPETMERLQGLDLLVLDALRYTPHPTHFNLDQALAAARTIKAGKTYFIHIAHEIQHADLATKLPENIFLSYDGLQLTV